MGCLGLREEGGDGESREAGMEGEDEKNDDDDGSILLGRRLGLDLIPGSGPDRPNLAN